MQAVAIVGAGLIGASFGLALRQAGFSGPILGVSSESAIAAAIERGAIDRGASLAEAAERADLIYLAQPIGRILETLPQLARLARPGTLITDAGSTKGEIVAQARQSIRTGIFLGGHPLAGKETRGAAEAEAGLFAGRTYVLTPLQASDLKTELVSEFVWWIRRIGARPVILEPEQHDGIVALTSHLPQLASTALAATLAGLLDTNEQLTISGPGLADTTRLALSSHEIWRDILATNPQAIDRALEAYIAKLEHFRKILGEPGMREQFETGAEFAKRLRDRLGS